jgi:hypothetical protein
MDPKDGTGEGYDVTQHAVRGGIRYPAARGGVRVPTGTRGDVRFPDATPELKYDSADELKARRDRLEREAARLSDRLAMLENLPEEPVFEDGEPSVIWFNRKFSRRDGKHYTYAAVRCGDGRWAVSGRQSPQMLTWADLIQWVREFEEVDVWVATAYESL